jgi:hypothetical protein
MSTWPKADRPDPWTPAALTPADERASLETWLEFHRATLLDKCAGLTPQQLATRSCPPSSLSLLGLVRHMADVESWFHEFDGDPLPPFYWSPGATDNAFDGVDPERADQDLANYVASVERARDVVAGHDLADISKQTDVPHPISLRWVYQHMIEEYARHNGHADLLRECIDGVTGD